MTTADYRCPGWLRSQATIKAKRLARIEDYQFLLSHGCQQEEIMKRLGVCKRTLERYNAAIKASK